MNKTLIVVGDIFSAFARHESVITTSELKQRALNRSSADDDAERIILGQGLNSADNSVLAQVHGVVAPTAPRASLRHTHKRTEPHVLISQLEDIKPHHYHCELALDDQSDRLSDHTTGEHIGGMILLEAGRQAMIAALESEYGQDGPMRWGLAWNVLNVRFVGYVYPIAVTMGVSVVETHVKSGTRMDVRVPVVMTQASKVVCELEFMLTLVERSVLSNLEHKQGHRALEAVVRSAQEPVAKLARPA